MMISSFKPLFRKSAPRRRSAFFRFALGLAILPMISGCALQSAPKAYLRPNNQTLVYTYLMAHGMARGYVMSGGVSREELIALVMVDRAALLAVATETASPSALNMRRAGDAVQMLLAAISLPEDRHPTITR